jgi:hypothetical protein
MEVQKSAAKAEQYEALKNADRNMIDAKCG